MFILNDILFLKNSSSSVPLSGRAERFSVYGMQGVVGKGVDLAKVKLQNGDLG